jgi:hypothetical protein
MSEEPTSGWRNRIIGSGVEDPAQLLANPFNFRYHPEHQQKALAGVLEEIGWIQEVVVNQRTGHLIDGHLRVTLAMRDGENIPVKYVDLSEHEEKIALASMDPISALATQDQGILDDLVEQIGAVWIEGDSRNAKELAPGEYDLLFSCPPYADLEVYSDNPADISTLGYDEFLAAYREIIANSCALLKDDRFAVFVVGEVRTPKGGYHGFVQDTIKAFEDAGLTYYNECVLLTNIAANAMRAAGAFTNSRKLTKGHQNALVFAKGSPRLHDIKGMSRAISSHFGDHREVFRAFENVMVFVKGDPKKATEAAGDAASIDLDGLALSALDE